MVHPVKITPTDAPRSSKAYFLSDVCLEIGSPDTATFGAKLNAPVGAQVWARAWLSNEVDGTLAETASAMLKAGDKVLMTVKLRDDRKPEIGCIRIESAPLATEDVVIMNLPRE
jgi:hypothetical protein